MELKRIVICCCAFGMMFFFLFSASAFRLAPELICETDERKTPENAFYIELLVLKEDLTEEQYNERSLNINNYNFSGDAEIVGYNENGYISYMFHCNGAVGESRLSFTQEGVSFNHFGADAQTDLTKEMKELFSNLHAVQFAYVDSMGNVLKVTDSAKVNTAFPLRERGVVHISGESVDVDFSCGPLPWPLLGGLFACVCVTVYLISIKRRNKWKLE